MARSRQVDGWTVVREYHPELDPDGSLCASALVDLYEDLRVDRPERDQGAEHKKAPTPPEA